MHRPDLLVLDEPTVGLDLLIQQTTFYAMSREAKSAGATIFLSSHVLPEVQHSRRPRRPHPRGTPSSWSPASRSCARCRPRVAVTFNDLLSRRSLRRDSGRPRTRTPRQYGPLLARGRSRRAVKALARERVVAIDSHEADLEDIFLNLYRSQGEQDAA